MDKSELDRLAAEFPDNEDLIQLYEDWGGSELLHEFFDALDAYEPDWNKEKELGGWAAGFLLEVFGEEGDELKGMNAEARRERYDELVDERYEDFRSGHQFARVNNINLDLQDGEDFEAVLAEGDEKITFPVLRVH